MAAPRMLRDDALQRIDDVWTLHVHLPWIRSLPLTSVCDLRVSVDGTEVAAHITAECDTEWWHPQEPLPIVVSFAGSGSSAAPSRIEVAFELLIPYLPGGPDRPLMLPFREALDLTVTPSGAAAEVSAEPTQVASPPARRPRPTLPEGWEPAASAFNWTPHILDADAPATEIVAGVAAAAGVATIELEPGQMWRSFPAPDDTEVDALRARLDATGTRVSIVGASLDDWASVTRRRTEEERLAFLLPQLHAAQRIGAEGVRLPIGQAGTQLLERLQPHLHKLGLTLYEEMQGPQHPLAPGIGEALEAIRELGDARVRVLVDCSMLMPQVPVTYLDALQRAGVETALVQLLANEWGSERTELALREALRSGSVPPQAMTLFMDLIVRFGRSDAADLRDVFPLTGAFHLKFWDLEDADDRISAPLRALGAELSHTEFRGTLCSEWGGHAWLDADPDVMTRTHLDLAVGALAEGAASAR